VARHPVRWLMAPEFHDYDAAQDYLSLLMPEAQARAMRTLLEKHAGNPVTRKAKDILRASGLPLLPRGNVHVAKDLAKIRAGEPLSPVLLARQAAPWRLLIADGYHRVCACEIHDENTPIRAVLI
jgi:hypothetical protein